MHTHTHTHTHTHMQIYHEITRPCVYLMYARVMCAYFRTLSRVYTASHTHVQELKKAFSMTPEAILAHASSVFDASAQKPRKKHVSGADVDGGEAEASAKARQERALRAPVCMCVSGSVPVSVALSVFCRVRTCVNMYVDRYLHLS
jgi:hypothetical protein